MNNVQLIKTNKQVISSDGRRVGFVERLTETDIITTFPHRHVPIGSIRRVTDEVIVETGTEAAAWR